MAFVATAWMIVFACPASSSRNAKTANECALPQEDLEQGPLVPLAHMAYREEGQTYTLLRREPGVLAGGKLEAVLHFKVKEIDPATGGPPLLGPRRQAPLVPWPLRRACSLPMACFADGCLKQEPPRWSGPEETTAMPRIGMALQSMNLCLFMAAGEPEEEGYQDEYQLEDVEIGPADYIKPIHVGNFRWRLLLCAHAGAMPARATLRLAEPARVCMTVSKHGCSR